MDRREKKGRLERRRRPWDGGQATWILLWVLMLTCSDTRGKVVDNTGLQLLSEKEGLGGALNT